MVVVVGGVIAVLFLRCCIRILFFISKLVVFIHLIDSNIYEEFDHTEKKIDSWRSFPLFSLSTRFFFSLLACTFVSEKRVRFIVLATMKVILVCERQAVEPFLPDIVR